MAQTLPSSPPLRLPFRRPPAPARSWSILPAPRRALAQAEVGIAIGAGTDVAVETADVVLVKSDPASVAVGIALARHVRGKIKQNLFWAAIYNVLAIPFAAGVLYPSYGVLLRPEWAALLMSASTVIVTLNALSLNRLRFDRPAVAEA